ncbi:MAG: DsbA family protein [Nitrosopumilaceae archaeon]
MVGLIVAVGISSFLGGFGLGSETDEPSENIIKDSKDVTGQTSANQPQSNPSSGIISVSLDDDPVKGDPNAPITMIEFSDFECPFCARFFTTTLPLIEKNYIETGKVKFVYRDFPLTDIHQNALPAAMAAECADEQGKFWELHDKIFENQKQWEGPDVQNGVRTFEQFAADLGLDTDKFNTCLESGKYLEEVQKDLNDGASYGVTGTPGFFIGNEKIGYGMVSGAQPYSAFQQVLDQLLAK